MNTPPSKAPCHCRISQFWAHCFQPMPRYTSFPVKLHWLLPLPTLPSTPLEAGLSLPGSKAAFLLPSPKHRHAPALGAAQRDRHLLFPWCCAQTHPNSLLQAAPTPEGSGTNLSLVWLSHLCHVLLSCPAVLAEALHACGHLSGCSTPQHPLGFALPCPKCSSCPLQPLPAWPHHLQQQADFRAAPTAGTQGPAGALPGLLVSHKKTFPDALDSSHSVPFPLTAQHPSASHHCPGCQHRVCAPGEPRAVPTRSPASPSGALG